jgi:hypothetical protein
VDAGGNGVAIWSQNNEIRTSRYDPDTGNGTWGSAEPINSNITGNAFTPSISVNVDGRALAVWRVGENTIVASQFTGGSWETAQQISSVSAASRVRNPEVGIDADGNALAVWSRADSELEPQTIVASRLVAGQDWSEPEVIESADDNAVLPKITVNGAGNGIAAWLLEEGANTTTVRTNRFE